VLTANATTTGECVANLFARQNEESETAQEPSGDGPPDTCNEFIVCGDISIFPGGGDGGPVLTALPPEGIVIQQEEVDNCASSDEEEYPG